MLDKIRRYIRAFFILIRYQDDTLKVIQNFSFYRRDIESYLKNRRERQIAMENYQRAQRGLDAKGIAESYEKDFLKQYPDYGR